MSVNIHNIALFLIGVIRHGIAPWRWPEAWHYISEGHQQEVHKIVWQLKCQGKIYSDREGRLWPK